MVGWESSSDVVCAVHGVPQGGLAASCGAGASGEPLLLQAVKGVLANQPLAPAPVSNLDLQTCLPTGTALLLAGLG